MDFVMPDCMCEGFANVASSIIRVTDDPGDSFPKIGSAWASSFFSYPKRVTFVIESNLQYVHA